MPARILLAALNRRDDAGEMVGVYRLHQVRVESELDILELKDHFGCRRMSVGESCVSHQLPSRSPSEDADQQLGDEEVHDQDQY